MDQEQATDLDGVQCTLAVDEARRLVVKPIAFRDACSFLLKHHRHHPPPRGWKFGTAAYLGEEIVGVIFVGRPVARHLDDGQTLEITRCCTDGTKNAASKLYAASVKAARALGYTRIVTYTLAEEAGVSLRAAGWREVYETKDRPRGWNCPSRPRTSKAPTGPKRLWQAP